MNGTSSPFELLSNSLLALQKKTLGVKMSSASKALDSGRRESFVALGYLGFLRYQVKSNSLIQHIIQYLSAQSIMA